jgi:hypothetical protein
MGWTARLQRAIRAPDVLPPEHSFHRSKAIDARQRAALEPPATAYATRISEAGPTTQFPGSDMTDLLLKRTGPFGNQYEVFAKDQVIGYIRLSSAARTATPWSLHAGRSAADLVSRLRQPRTSDARCRHAGVRLAQGVNVARGKASGKCP